MGGRVHGRSCGRPDAVSADGSAGAAMLVETLEPVILTLKSCPDLEDRFGTTLDPKLFSALDPFVELL